MKQLLLLMMLTTLSIASYAQDVVKNWMRLKNTIEYLGVWEMLNNPNFKGVEFDPLLRLQKLNQIAIQQMTVLKNVESKQTYIESIKVFIYKKTQLYFFI